MSLAFVQAAPSPTSDSTPSNTRTLTFTSAVTSGNAIIGHVGWFSSTITLTSVTDNFGNSYTLYDNPTTSGSNRMATFVAFNVTGGSSFAVTATFSAQPTSGSEMGCHEVSGGANAVDTHKIAQVISFSTSGTVSTTIANSGAYLYVGFFNFTGGTNTLSTIGSPFTLEDNAHRETGSADAVITTNGAVSATVTTGTNSTWWGCYLAIYVSTGTIQRDGPGVASSNTTNTTKTWNHTISGPNSILFVCANVDQSHTLTATYNTVSMTEIGHQSIFGDSTRSIYMWYITGVAAGTHQVKLTASASSNLSGLSMAYINAAQSGQPDNFVLNHITSGSQIDLSLTTNADNCWMIVYDSDSTSGHVSAVSPAQLEATTGTTALISQGPYTPAGSNTISMTPTGTHSEDYILASFAPAGGGSTVNSNFFAFF